MTFCNLFKRELQKIKWLNTVVSKAHEFGSLCIAFFFRNLIEIVPDLGWIYSKNKDPSVSCKYLDDLSETAQAPIMAATNLLAPVFFSQLILLFTLTSRPCVGNGNGTRLSVMAAGFGVPIPLTRRLLSVGFARSRFPVSKSIKYGLTSLLIPGHDPPVDITIFIDVPKNPGPYASTCSRLSCSDLSSDLSTEIYIFARFKFHYNTLGTSLKGFEDTRSLIRRL